MLGVGWGQKNRDRIFSIFFYEMPSKTVTLWVSLFTLGLYHFLVLLLLEILSMLRKIYLAIKIPGLLCLLQFSLCNYLLFASCAKSNYVNDVVKNQN